MKLALMIGAPDMKPGGYVDVPTGPYAETVARAARLGFDGVEVLAGQRQTGDLFALRQALNNYGLALASLNSGRLMSDHGLALLCGDSRQCGMTRSALYDLMRLAAPFGAHINIGMFRGLPTPAEAEAGEARLVGLLQQYADYAERLGIQLLLEPQNRKEFPFVASTREGLALVRAVGRPAISLMLDTFHMLTENEDPRASVEQAGPALRHIHLLDMARNPPMPGRGPLDLEGLVRALARARYTGYLSVPLVRGAGDETTAEVVGALRALIQEHSSIR